MSDEIYRKHEYVANSDLKRLKKQFSTVEEPKNLDEIFSFGTLVHQLILEPHLADFTHKDIKKGIEMRDTFLNDHFCRTVVKHPNFRPEHEFYRKNIMGIEGKCKMDGELRDLRTILEFKSLGIQTQKAFEDAIIRFDYDMGAAWYLDVSSYDHLLIAAVSKKKTDQLFKLVLDRQHPLYLSGKEKYTFWVNKWKELID